GGIVEAVATAADGLATSPVAVSLAWVRDQPGVTAPILGARTLGQLTAALACDTIALPNEIRDALDDVSAPPVGYPEDVS
ncbi:MAG: aldo/keto reductase, partial [Jatrophihabitantaceae bacterium]